MTIGYARAELRRELRYVKETQLTGLAEAVDACHHQLSDIDRRTTEIKDTQLAGIAKTIGDFRSELDRQRAIILAGLPRPPSRGWVTLAIVGTLMLGGAAGIALRHPSLLSTAVEKLR
jgi:hypothetical protein